MSGGAQYRRGGILLHHGTLLFDSDLDVLSQALKVSEEKFRSKGVKSVRARVGNIRTFLPQARSVSDFIALLEERIEGLTPRELTAEDRAEVETLMKEKYATWDWNYGESPEFTELKKARFPWGGVEAYLKVDKGLIVACELRGDYFGNGDYAPLLERIAGIPYTRSDLERALSGLSTHAMFAGSTAEDLLTLFSPGA